ncbi:hypothetical protein A2690_00840 [Candidatus Roizmanbacteria bacterium RIFCSPHIGHO2_01_FULL_39_12b]|uniref:DUF6922 domain-containing protein n=1 Tax=Candidatus Roizmanbacteria bacterium RIFCSPHIGHO2_01_FULL_39_12b TaxID=1802030 RepID=A0A1F7GB24_9BACT|nr:MAG: hypothetical protein A2690_00840 [Candidatus Roizmanbacteria bacterium RIFCSPHIGHO2_01_FULL_39_12b]
MLPPIKIPKSLYKFFWDVNPEKVNPREKPYFVIQRLLDKGDIEAVRFVRGNFEPSVIQKTLKNYRDFSLRSASFWGLLYQVPLSQIKCFQEPYLTTRKTLWPY